MSLQFSSSSLKAGIVEMIDATVGTNSLTYPITEKTRDINLALDKVFSLIFQVGGTWQFDDSNHIDHPIITTNIVSGQRDYSFTTDGSGNLILDIYKVMVADENGIFFEVFPVDQQGNAPMTYSDGQNTRGSVLTYDKTGNGIFLDLIPNYNRTGGLKVWINRTASYFTAVADMTALTLAMAVKKPGFAGLFHEYCVLRPSYQYAFRKGLPNMNILKAEMLEMEREIQDYYKSRERDVVKTLSGKINNYK
jgi:hypothetical protein